MISKKTLLLITLAFTFLLLNAIPSNTIVPIDMDNPSAATQDGSVVVGSGYEEAYMWTEEGGLVFLGEGVAYNISDNLLIAGEKKEPYGDTGNIYSQAGYWDMDGIFTLIPNLPNANPSDGFLSHAYAISADGTTLAGMDWLAGWQTAAFRWSAATGIVNLYDDDSARVNSLSSDGSIAGGWITSDFGGRFPVYWDADNVMHYAVPFDEDNGGEVMGVSRNGEYICGYTYDGGFVKHGEQTYIFNSDEWGDQIFANHVTDNGLTVGLFRNLMMWTQGGFVYSPEMGYMDAKEYFINQGVNLGENIMIYSVSWVSEDGKIFLGTYIDYDTSTMSGFVLKISDSATINGHITLNGGNGNVTETTISNGFVSTHPDNNGNYSLSVSPGSHQLTVSLNGYISVVSAVIEVETQEEVNNMNFTLAPISNPATVQGTITLANGNGIMSNVLIKAGNFSCHPNDAGQYSLYLPAGEHQFEVRLTGYYTYRENITLNANQVVTRDLNLYIVGTSATANFSINTDEPYDAIGAEFVFTKVEDPYWLFTDFSGSNFTKYYDQGVYNFSLYLPGYFPQVIENVVLNAGTEIDIVFEPEKKYYTPLNVASTSEGLMSWNAPLPINANYEDFESFDVNTSIYKNNPMWKAFNGQFLGENDGIVSNEYSKDGFNSLKVIETSDIFVDLHNIWATPEISSGKYVAEFSLFVPDNKGAHYNILRTTSGYEFTFEVFFKPNGSVVYYANNEVRNTNYNLNSWNDIKHEIDVDNNTINFIINGEEVYSWQLDKNAYDAQIGQKTISIIDFSGESDPNGTPFSGLFYLDCFAFYNVEGATASEYNVYLDNSVVDSNIEDLTYQLTSFPAGNHVVGVSAVYGNVESEVSSASVNFVANDDIVALQKDSIRNYPNPFNPETTISFNVAKEGKVLVEIYNVKGQKVKTLYNAVGQAGQHNIVWKGENDYNQKVGSGIYFLRLKTERSDLKKKVMLLK
ncbi:MAG TPA: T9SS type A sorting domain-containing protein [Candidatus Cloacimonadota bacterium]|nr:T9SS type A sorting domain-containing protein [Candidatus Cloacimonadota bacterium]